MHCICVYMYILWMHLFTLYPPLLHICTTGHLASCCVFLAFCDSTSSRRTRHGISGFASAKHGVSPCIEWRGCNAPRIYGKLTGDLCAMQKPWYPCSLSFNTLQWSAFEEFFKQVGYQFCPSHGRTVGWRSEVPILQFQTPPIFWPKPTPQYLQNSRCSPTKLASFFWTWAAGTSA
jgi:hypothetical protein